MGAGGALKHEHRYAKYNAINIGQQNKEMQRLLDRKLLVF